MSVLNTIEAQSEDLARQIIEEIETARRRRHGEAIKAGIAKRKADGTYRTGVKVNVSSVTGGHTNRHLARRRRLIALEMRCAGWTYQEIADLLGYSNVGTVHSIVMKASDEAYAMGLRNIDRALGDL